MTTNEFERDLDDQAGLKRPGRIDMRVFQNTPDAGDGHPGVQRCFRNYLHEGGIEKDIQLLGFGILGDSVNINNSELQQLSNISGTTISAAQWVFVGQADQNVRIADSPTFGGLSINGSITITGNVDGVDVSDLKTAFDTHKASTGSDHTYIDQTVTIVSSPRFVNLNIEDVVQHFGDVDNEIQFGTGTQTFQVASATTILDLNSSGLRIGGANVRVTGIVDSDSLGTSDVILCTQGNTKAYVDAHAGATGASHTYINQDVSSSATPTFNGLSANNQKITSLGTPTLSSDAATFAQVLYNMLPPVKGFRYDGSWADQGEYFEIVLDGGLGSLFFEFLVPITWSTYKLKVIYSTTAADNASIYINAGKNSSTTDVLNDQHVLLGNGSFLLVTCPNMSLSRGDYLRVEIDHKTEGGDSGNLRIYGFWLSGA